METFREIVDAVLSDMGLTSGNSVADVDAVKRYVNLGHIKLSRELIKLREDYFLTYYDIDESSDPALSREVSEYPLPPDILINKIRMVSYRNYNEYFQVNRVDLETYLSYSYTYDGGQSIPAGYFILQNPTPPGEKASVTKSKIVFLPIRSLQNVKQVRVHYLRQLTPLVNDDDVPDIPECQEFLYYYALHRVSVTDPNYATTSDMHYKAWDEALKNLLETFVDKTPRDGGELFRMSEESALAGMNMGDV